MEDVRKAVSVSAVEEARSSIEVYAKTKNGNKNDDSYDGSHQAACQQKFEQDLAASKSDFEALLDKLEAEKRAVAEENEALQAAATKEKQALMDEYEQRIEQEKELEKVNIGHLMHADARGCIHKSMC